MVLPPPSRSFLLLAPHLEYPPRNGADVTHVELAGGLSTLFPEVVLVAASEVATYSHGHLTDRYSYANRMRSKVTAAARTVVRRTHYFLEKFVTPDFAQEALRYLENPAYGTVLHSYLTTATLASLPDLDRTHLVWTHNDEFRWFEDLRRETRSPVVKAVASSSIRWIQRYLGEHRADLTLLHVTEEDRAGWAKYFPKHRGHVVPIGVVLRPHPAPPLEPGSSIRLLFVGSLSTRMNYDALVHFADRFWPVLKDRFGAEMAMTVVGSQPLEEVQQLAERAGWSLRPDVSDEELDRLFESATFSILPFSYATGAKLKLLKSLSYGVPVLATEAVSARRDLAQDPSLFSDDPNEWATRIATVRAEGIDVSERRMLLGMTESHSWAASARQIADLVND